MEGDWPAKPAEMRAQGYACIDKTPFVAQLAEQGKDYFLARPRRFGKSLFVDTMTNPPWITCKILNRRER